MTKNIVKCPRCGHEFARKNSTDREKPISQSDFIGANFPLPVWASCELARTGMRQVCQLSPPDPGFYAQQITALMWKAVRDQKLPKSPVPGNWYHFEQWSYVLGGTSQHPRTRGKTRIARKHLIIRCNDPVLARDFRELCRTAGLTVSSAVVRMWAYYTHGVDIDQWDGIENIDTSRSPRIKQNTRCPTCLGYDCYPIDSPDATTCPLCHPGYGHMPYYIFKDLQLAGKLPPPRDPNAPPPAPKPVPLEPAPQPKLNVIYTGKLQVPVDPLADALAEYERQKTNPADDL